MSLENAHQTLKIALSRYCAALAEEAANQTPLVVLPIEQAPCDPNETLLLLQLDANGLYWVWADLGFWQPDGNYWETESTVECQPTHFMRVPDVPNRPDWTIFQSVEPQTIGNDAAVNPGEFFAVPVVHLTGKFLWPKAVGPFTEKEALLQALAERGIYGRDLRDMTNIEPLIK